MTDPAPAPAPAAPAPAAPAAPAPAAPAADAPFYHAWTQDAGIRQALHSAAFKTPEDLARSYVETKALVGRKGAIVPGENDPPERWAQYHKDIGAVEAPDKIVIPALEGAQPSDFETRLMTAMRPAFHKAGLTQRQINILAKEGYHSFAKGEMATLAAEQAANTEKGEGEIAALRATLGPKADAFIAGAQRAARALLGKDNEFAGDLDKLLGSGRFVKLMGTLGEQFFREGSPALNAAASGFAMTKEQAVVEIAKMNGDPNAQKILQDRQHPEYKLMVQKRDELYRVAYPEERAA